MKTTLMLLFVLALILYSGKINIQLSPFKITFERPYEMFGVFFFILAFVFLRLSEYKRGYMEGFNDGVKEMADECRKIVKNK